MPETETVTEDKPQVGLLDECLEAHEVDRGVLGQLRPVDQLDGVSDTIRQRGYLTPYTTGEWTFDRYFFEDPTLVDVVLAGAPRDEQEAQKRVAEKRDWCKARGARYLVVVDELSYS